MAFPAWSQIRTIEDLVFRQTKNYWGSPLTLKLDLYLPQGTAPRPVVVLCHPGSYTGGDKRDLRHLGQVWADHGLAALSINYHLGSKKDPSTEAEAVSEVYADVLACFRWIKVHAREYHLDPDKVFISGGSSGGHLALTTGILYPQEKEKPVRLRGVIGMYGGYFTQGISEHSTPLLILQGTLDRSCLPDASRLMARAYKKAGAWCELVIIEGMYHDWDGDDYRDKLVARAWKFIQRASQERLPPAADREEFLPADRK